jgi:hypothetical protein
MTMTSKARRAVLIGAAAVTLCLGAVMPATASATPAAPATANAVSEQAASPNVTPICPAGSLCFWVDQNYGGPRGQFSGDNPAWGSYPQSQCQDGSGGGPYSNGTWNDCASSLYNNGNSDAVQVWRDSNYRSDSTCVPRGTLWASLPKWQTNSGEPMNDEISSNRWVLHC